MKKSNDSFRPLIFIFLAVFAMAAATLGFPAVLIYLLMIKLIYSVVISIVINEWKNKNKLVVESSKDTNWDGYFLGAPIPVKDTRSTLKNLHFNNKKNMRASYLKLLIPKATFISILLITLLESVYKSYLSSEHLLFPLFGYISVIYMVYKLFECIKSIKVINYDSWCIKEQQLDKKIYCSAYIKESEKYYLPFLSEVFK
ncbi:hypothetical protein L4D76_21365 [Photobacterium sagamiensis]|uniref:hypothetical protein n=1 Tax=Photobacterium sagamiensis TaxID=2910241 RepID=UPI003D12F60B